MFATSNPDPEWLTERTHGELEAKMTHRAAYACVKFFSSSRIASHNKWISSWLCVSIHPLPKMSGFCFFLKKGYRRELKLSALYQAGAKTRNKKDSGTIKLFQVFLVLLMRDSCSYIKLYRISEIMKQS